MIIIKTPQPDTEERLVLVPMSTVNFACMRDATPADLARGGWVRGGVVPWERLATEAGAELADLRARAEKAEAHAAELALEREEAIARAEKAERELEDAESRAAHMLTVIRERDTLRDTLTDERDCGRDDGVCAKPPGCARHWEARCRELVAERDRAIKDLAASGGTVAKAMAKAAEKFGGTDGEFNAAGFSQALYEVIGLRGILDGHVVRAILDGRADCEKLDGGSHFRILPVRARPA